MPSQLKTQIGEAYHALHHNAQELARDGYAVVDGCAPSIPGTGLEVDIAAGRVQTDGSTASVGSATVTLDTADPDDPRKDVVVYDPSIPGFTSITGTPNAVPIEQGTDIRFDTYRPSPPDLETDDVVLVAEVWVAADVTDLTSDDLRDRRVAPATPVVAGTTTATLTGGSDPAADVTVQDVDADQTDPLTVVVYPDADPSFAEDYAFNFDSGRYWDDSAGAFDIPVTVTWDTDPGGGNDVTARIDVINGGR